MLNRYAAFGQPRLPTLELITVDGKGDMQLAIAIMWHLPVLRSAFLAQQENLMTANSHGGEALIRVEALEAQNLAVELH